MDTPSPTPPSSADRGPALIINDGSLPALLACWAEGVIRPATLKQASSGGVGPVAWFPSDDRPARERRRDAAYRQVDLCGLSGFSERTVVRFDPPSHTSVPEPIALGSRATTMLLSAAIEATSLGLSRVIWPIHSGASLEVDTDALADVCDRALLVGQLLGIDLSRGGHGLTTTNLRIETPYADLTDMEVMDLALDMDAPLHAAWWCLNDDDRPCSSCAGCMRWREALAAVDPAGRLDIHVLASEPVGEGKR